MTKASTWPSMASTEGDTSAPISPATLAARRLVRIGHQHPGDPGVLG